MGYGGFGHTKQRGDVAYAHFVLKKPVEDFHPRRVAENFKKFRQIKQRLIVRHTLFDRINNLFVYDIAVASVFQIVRFRHVKPFLILIVEQLFNCNYNAMILKSQGNNEGEGKKVFESML
jgi:hypothetical protein